MRSASFVQRAVRADQSAGHQPSVGGGAQHRLTVGAGHLPAGAGDDGEQRGDVPRRQDRLHTDVDALPSATSRWE